MALSSSSNQQPAEPQPTNRPLADASNKFSFKLKPRSRNANCNAVDGRTRLRAWSSERDRRHSGMALYRRRDRAGL